MKIQRISLVVAIGLSFITVKGQSIKDYFLPDPAYNKVSFYKPDNTGESTGMGKVIYYIKSGENYDITVADFLNGKYGSVNTKTIQFSAAEVKMIKATLFGNKKQNYSPPRTILKMPTAGQTLSWTYTAISGDAIKCKASLTTVAIDGTQRKAIKLVEIITGAEDWGKTIAYYVKGIGLWKTDIVTVAGETTTLDKFDKMEYEPTEK